MPVLKLTLAYDGADFHGWQVQPGKRTIQETMERVLAKIAGHPVVAVASGRTDAGVHALAQIVSFHTTAGHPLELWLRALNAELPHDMAVHKIEESPPDFHARRDATGKHYRYLICDGRVSDVFSRRYAWHVYRPLDVAAMQRAAEPLVGKHDFASFQSAGSDRKTTVRTVKWLMIKRPAGDVANTVNAAQGANESTSAAVSSPLTLAAKGVQIDIAADGFLYNMVRIIVGTLVQVGRGVRPESWPGTVLAEANRRYAAPAAPPQGLFLVAVDYD
jgi:tRNA pseudouridine38-40 synthase